MEKCVHLMLQLLHMIATVHAWNFRHYFHELLVSRSLVFRLGAVHLVHTQPFFGALHQLECRGRGAVPVHCPHVNWPQWLAGDSRVVARHFVIKTLPKQQQQPQQQGVWSRCAFVPGLFDDH